MKKDTIAWECPACGHRHLWKWDKGEASEWGVTMECDKCGRGHRTSMLRIGANVWSVFYDSAELEANK